MEAFALEVEIYFAQEEQGAHCFFKRSNQRINWASWTHDTKHLSWLAMVSILENNQVAHELA